MPKVINVNNVKRDILDVSKKLFFEKGIHGSSIDDICDQLGISKKSFYQILNDKEELVIDVVKDLIDQYKDIVAENIRIATNPVEEIVNQCLITEDVGERMNPLLFLEMLKAYPNAKDYLVESKRDFFITPLENTIAKGKEQGYFKPEVDALAYAILRYEEVEIILNPRVFIPQRFNVPQILKMRSKQFCHGILSEKGFVLYNEIINRKR